MTLEKGEIWNRHAHGRHCEKTETENRAVPLKAEEHKDYQENSRSPERLPK